MFEGRDFPSSLDNDQFDQWLEDGRQSKLSYSFLLIVWDELESSYKPVYTEDRDEIDNYETYGESKGHESLVAAYNIYSESRIK